MTSTRRTRIAVLFCGGTAVSRGVEPWERVRSVSDMERWLQHMPELLLVADIEPVFITGKRATDIGVAEWLSIAGEVKKRYASVDGVLILHGIETLHYTANALALMLGSLPIPVVLSGSPLRADSRVPSASFGARANIINAAQVATADLAEVCVVFGNRIMRASRVQLGLQGATLQLTTIDGSFLGRIDFGTTFSADRVKRSLRKPSWRIHCEPNVFVMTAAPGSVLPLTRAIDSGIRGIVVRSAQDFLALSPPLVRELERASRKNIPVIIASPQRIRGLPERLIPLVGVSASMAVVKSMWATGGARNHRAVRTLLERDVAGEFARSRGTI